MSETSAASRASSLNGLVRHEFRLPGMTITTLLVPLERCSHRHTKPVDTLGGGHHLFCYDCGYCICYECTKARTTVLNEKLMRASLRALHPAPCWALRNPRSERNNMTLKEQLKNLHAQARELCWDIERLPASEQQTELSIKASATAQQLQEWVRSMPVEPDGADKPCHTEECACGGLGTSYCGPGCPLP